MPTLPDKGERIRAYHEVKYLAERYRLHVACIAAEERPLREIDKVKRWCASFHFQRNNPAAMLRGAMRFLMGGSLSAGYFHLPSLRKYVETLNREVRLSATVAFSSVMAPYAPKGVPLLLDMVDVDSAKWAEYARQRWPGWLYGVESRRLLELERESSRVARSVILTTQHEVGLLRRIVPEMRICAIENGVDFCYFDPDRTPESPELAARQYVVMVGAMNYFPNWDGAMWFANEVFPVLRANIPRLEFLIVGHKPPAALQNLSRPGIVVTGYVPDVRPYIANSLLVVTPLRIARGVQNKVLEALAMGKTVASSKAIGTTFGEECPAGLRICHSAQDYLQAAEDAVRNPEADMTIRAEVMKRFHWAQKLAALDEELAVTLGST